MDNLTEQKLAKLIELAAAAQSYINNMVGMDVVPQFERDTWAKQEAEAAAWVADKNAVTNIIDGIVTRSGESREALLRGAHKKAQSYASLAAAVIGQRRAYAAAIRAAETVDELEAIQFVFSTEAV